jgi:hypothetical protein
MIPVGGWGKGRLCLERCGGTAGYTGYYCTATGRNYRLYYYYYYYYYYYTDTTENIKHFE